MKWLEEYLPPPEKWDEFRGSLISFKDRVKEGFEIGMKHFCLFVCLCA